LKTLVENNFETIMSRKPFQQKFVPITKPLIIDLTTSSDKDSSQTNITQGGNAASAGNPCTNPTTSQVNIQDDDEDEYGSFDDEDPEILAAVYGYDTEPRVTGKISSASATREPRHLGTPDVNIAVGAFSKASKRPFPGDKGALIREAPQKRPRSQSTDCVAMHNSQPEMISFTDLLS
jgi:hypothetical protein